MPAGSLADPARIRRVRRAETFARVVDADVLAERADAQDGFANVIESFWSSTDDAQALLEERGALVMTSRRHEAAETAEPMKMGTEVPIVPRVPSVKMVDPTSALDNLMLVTGLAVDFEAQRNSIEALG